MLSRGAQSQVKVIAQQENETGDTIRSKRREVTAYNWKEMWKMLEDREGEGEGEKGGAG